jgi:hypothetical protein
MPLHNASLLQLQQTHTQQASAVFLHHVFVIAPCGMAPHNTQSNTRNASPVFQTAPNYLDSAATHPQESTDAAEE